LTTSLLILGVLALNCMMIFMLNKLSRELGSNDAFIKKQRKFFKKEGRIQEVISRPTPKFDKLAILVDRMRTPDGGGENN